MSDRLLTIDGSQGEGGGQILRTSLGLSICLGKNLELTRIRANRPKPGLQPQHLAAVLAAKTVSGAYVEGARLGSQHLVFRPRCIKPGGYSFSIGTAGSTSLVLQTILPALMLADAPSKLTLEGGTHNPLAPPYEFVREAFLPLIHRMGPTISIRLERPGFAPRGGGVVHATVHPVKKLRPLHILERGPILQLDLEVQLSHLPVNIAEREISLITSELDLPAGQAAYKNITAAYGPGNVIIIRVRSEAITEVFSAFGKRGLAAEKVAQQVANEVSGYLESNVPIGQRLADQLLIPLALAGQGGFLTQTPSTHTLTNMAVIDRFMDIQFELEEIRTGAWLISLA